MFHDSSYIKRQTLSSGGQKFSEFACYLFSNRVLGGTLDSKIFISQQGAVAAGDPVVVSYPLFVVGLSVLIFFSCFDLVV